MSYNLPHAVIDSLISMVHLYPELWDESNPQFQKKNAYAQGAAWIKIKNALGYSVHELKTQWDKLVMEFRNEIRCKPKFSSGSANIEWQPKFPFFNEMMFIYDKLSKENSKCSGNLDNLVNYQEITPSTSRSRDINETAQHGRIVSIPTEIESNEIFRFFQSMIIPLIVHLPGDRLLDFRLEVNELIDDLAYNTTDSTLSHTSTSKSINKKLKK